MKRLGLLRHAKSDWGDLSLKDFDRGLNGRGRRGAALMGTHLARAVPAFDLILASPAARVRRTLEAAGLVGRDGPPVHYEDAAYLADSETLMGLLRRVPGDPASVLLVGHNPGLHDLALALLALGQQGAQCHDLASKFPTAAFALFELPITRWQALKEGEGRLLHFARPRDLDPSLGPEDRS